MSPGEAVLACRLIDERFEHIEALLIAIQNAIEDEEHVNVPHVANLVEMAMQRADREDIAKLFRYFGEEQS